MAVARFAIERERLAREVGMQELSGPATLGVVNMSAKRYRGDSDGKTVRQQAPGRGGHGGMGSKEERRMKREGEEEQKDKRSPGEILLEKLESAAEARSFQVKF